MYRQPHRIILLDHKQLGVEQFFYTPQNTRSIQMKKRPQRPSKFAQDNARYEDALVVRPAFAHEDFDMIRLREIVVQKVPFVSMPVI